MKFISRLCLMTLTLFVPLNCLWAQEAQPQQKTNQSADQLVAATRMERLQATRLLLKEQGEIRNRLVVLCKTLLANPDPEFDGPFDQVLKVVGQLRIESLTSPLLTRIDFQLDPKSAPVGGFLGAASYYPVAQALIKINGRKLTDGVMRRVAGSTDETTLRICVWVLTETQGKDLTTFLVQSRLVSITATLEKLGRKTNPEKDNLEKALQILDSEVILLDPTIAQGTIPK